MGWKEWPSWVKGGIIGIILAILAFLGVIVWISNQPPMLWGASGLEFLTGNPAAGILLFYILIILLFVFAVPGILIGWIIGKIKKR